jgi:hypothetical protein
MNSDGDGQALLRWLSARPCRTPEESPEVDPPRSLARREPLGREYVAR